APVAVIDGAEPAGDRHGPVTTAPRAGELVRQTVTVQAQPRLPQGEPHGSGEPPVVRMPASVGSCNHGAPPKAAANPSESRSPGPRLTGAGAGKLALRLPESVTGRPEPGGRGDC